MSRRRFAAATKKLIIERANHCCEYCLSQAKFATSSFSIEHIIPVSKGGSNELDNLALACQGCNAHKYNKTKAIDPITLDKVVLFHPRRHVWEEHLSWNEDYTLIIGKSPIGRATIEALKLNRENLKNLRQILFSAGEHPPT